ncbi:ABC transporter permease [uncultured Enterococcus sp.]|uniref:ABC transporter permease n=1 Tax=uncultured Enterococcus sp. TaxID=167972 RepID=UPI0025F1D898|nr:ABC transporter permease [uncultured Enterococcus sp.]
MRAVFLFGLKKELLSIRALIVGIIFSLVSFLIANYSQSLAIFIDGNSPAIDTLFGIYAILGFFFSSILFSNIITTEFKNQTFRYVTPYVSRMKIYLAKFLLMISYFVAITLIGMVVLFLGRHQFYIPIYNLFNLFIFYAYVEAITLLLSTISTNERFSSLLGILISVGMPILYAVIYFKHNLILDIVDWILPFKYLEGTWEISILIVFVIGILYVGEYFFERKDL